MNERRMPQISRAAYPSQAVGEPQSSIQSRAEMLPMPMPMLRAPGAHGQKTMPAPALSMPVMVRPKSSRSVNIVLAIDGSTSMKGRKIAAANKAAGDLVYAIASLPGAEKFKIEVIEFGEVARVLEPRAGISPFVTPVYEVGARSGGTNITAALELAEFEIQRCSISDHAAGLKSSAVLILLSDGEHNCGGIRPEAVAQRLASAGVNVVTIGFGTDADHTALSRIASGNLSFTAYDEAALRALFVKLGATLSQAAAAGTPFTALGCTI